MDESEFVRAEAAIDVSPKLRERLRGPTDLGHNMTADIDAAIKSARVDDKKSGKGLSSVAGTADGDASVEAASSPQSPPAQGDGAVTSDQPRE